MKLTKKEIPIILIMILGAFLRLYQLKEVAYFEYDDQYNSYLIYNLVHNHKFSLVGQEMSYGGMFLGPWHYLYLTPFYLLTNLDPIGGYIGESVIGLLAIYSYYFIGKRMFSEKVGLVSAFLRAIMISQIINDHMISPAYPSELVALWFIYFLWRLKNGSRSAIIILSFLFGLMFSVHLAILPLIVVWLLLLIIYRPIKIDKLLIIKSFLVFLIPTSPIILFELRHNFSHFLRFIGAVSTGSEGMPAPVFGEKAYQIIKYNLESFYSLIFNFNSYKFLGIIIFLLTGYLVIKKIGQFKNNSSKFIFFGVLGVAMIYYLIYPKHVPEYYFISVTPIVILFVSAMLISLEINSLGKVIVTFFLGLGIVCNLYQWLQAFNNLNQFALGKKQETVKAIIDHQRGKGDFSISYFMDYGRQYGFQYFFTYYNLEPRPEIKPPIYSIVLPRKLVNAKDLSLIIGDIGVIYPEDEPEQGN